MPLNNNDNNSDLLAVEQHAVDFGDGVVGSLLCLEVDETVAAGSILVANNLRRKEDVLDGGGGGGGGGGVRGGIGGRGG